MLKKILLAALLGGLAMFIWSFVVHSVLPIGEAGISTLPNEEIVLKSLKENIPEKGFYFFPGMIEGTDEDTWMEKYKAGPVGIMMIHPAGREPMMPSQLLLELLSDIIVLIIAGFLLSKALDKLPSFGSRVFFILLIGVIPFLVADFSYWNWYGFPAVYSLGQLTDQVIGFFLAGLIAAWKIKPALNQ
jgi:hypothetical protein